MHCDKVLKHLDDHLDGLLAAPVSEEIRTHLGDCPACEADAGHSRAAMESMASWGDLEPPAGCFDSIMERIEALPPDALAPETVPLGLRIIRSRVARWVATSGAAAAAALLIGVSLTSTTHTDTRRRVRGAPMAAVKRFPTKPIAGLLAGELPLTPALFDEQDYEKDDGLRRRRLTEHGNVPGVPASLEVLETKPR